MKNCISRFLKDFSLDINEKFTSEIRITKINNKIRQDPKTKILNTTFCDAEIFANLSKFEPIYELNIKYDYIVNCIYDEKLIIHYEDRNLGNENINYEFEIKFVSK